MVEGKGMSAMKVFILCYVVELKIYSVNSVIVEQFSLNSIFHITLLNIF